MDILPVLLKEMEQEANTTRKFMALVPDDKLDWQPHVKSLKLGQLASHIAELGGWVAMTLTTPELDFQKNEYKPFTFSKNEELMEFFEKNCAAGHDQMAIATEPQLLEPWALRSGDVIFSSGTRLEFLRVCYCQIVHHRAQLGVYLRMLDIPLPGSYGPSADGN
ncbi:MAG: DinB family protein [Taibaiella sp.]|nr:DinB family protein [Taibaiella sp.]